MNVEHRYLKIVASVVAWSSVLLTSTYWSHTQVVVGQYSWGQVTLLGLLISTAVMADHFTHETLSYWSKKFSLTMMASPWNKTLGSLSSREGVHRPFSEAVSYFVAILMSCKRATHRLMSSGSPQR